jgi:hypothetical protein
MGEEIIAVKVDLKELLDAMRHLLWPQHTS